MLGLSASTIETLLWLAFIITAYLSFLRGMRALEQIAARLERIELLLRNSLPGPNPSKSHTAT